MICNRLCEASLGSPTVSDDEHEPNSLVSTEHPISSDGNIKKVNPMELVQSI